MTLPADPPFRKVWCSHGIQSQQDLVVLVPLDEQDTVPDLSAAGRIQADKSSSAAVANRLLSCNEPARRTHSLKINPTAKLPAAVYSGLRRNCF